jgi:hypothetical protein
MYFDKHFGKPSSFSSIDNDEIGKKLESQEA